MRVSPMPTPKAGGLRKPLLLLHVGEQLWGGRWQMCCPRHGDGAWAALGQERDRSSPELAGQHRRPVQVVLTPAPQGG